MKPAAPVMRMDFSYAGSDAIEAAMAAILEVARTMGRGECE